MALDPRAAESLLAFWADAGVDTLYGAAPAERITHEPIAVARTTPEGPVAKVTKTVDMEAAREAAWAAADLGALEAAIAAYDGCSLKFQGARQAVFARGTPQAEVMIIGEAPGAEEDAQGAPFVGRAGRLLDKMLAAAGLDGRVFITNTVFWRPPGNRTPSVEEQLACAPFLERAIDLVRPKLLLLAGAASAKSMLEKNEGILALRGRWFEWRARSTDLEIPALPTLHPAFLLRQPSAKKKAWQDLLLLAERLDRSERPA
jgi:DNA polymerase